jgi:sigma-E factor negative regulatory protein RseC
MIEESGEIIACEGEYAWVETQRKSACGSCSVNKGCGTGALSKMYGDKFSRVKALNPISAHQGEVVILGLAEEALVRGSLMMYGVPLVGLILGAVLGVAIAESMALESSDGVTALLGIAGLALGFYVVRLFNQRVARDERYQPVVLRRCDADTESIVQIEH